MSQLQETAFESSAQNLEDVVLWRVLHGIRRGCYVDVGACDPVVDSISSSFYRQGWRGALVEPVPALAQQLRRRRPGDVTIEAAAGAENGTASLFVSDSVASNGGSLQLGWANSTLVRDVATRISLGGVDFSETVVRIAPLDDLLHEAGFDGRTIHFCTIDVEGSEADVLAGFDLARWRPWILVVEATEPNRPRASHGAWEERVLNAGYRFCLFDGLNRFYVHPDKADELAQQLSFPACMFDAPFARFVSAARRAEELERERAALAVRAAELQARVDAMESSNSWRLTRPLRAAAPLKRTLVRRLTRAR